MPLDTTSQEWRRHAADAQAMADRVTDPSIRRSMLIIAHGYEVLANHSVRMQRLVRDIEYSQRECGVYARRR